MYWICDNCNCHDVNCRNCEKYICCFLLIIGFICGSLYLSGFDNGITVVEKIFTMVSPFSLLKIGEIGITLKEINVYGHFIPLQNGIFFVQIVLIMIILAITYLVEKGRRAIR